MRLKASAWDVWGSLQLIHGSVLLSVVDASDADDEGSSSEAEEPAVDLSDEHSSSEESAVELSNEWGSSSEDSDDHSQQPLATLQTPPLDFPTSPAPHEAVLDNVFNMEGYDQQSDIISGWYATEEEVQSLLFNVLD